MGVRVCVPVSLFARTYERVCEYIFYLYVCMALRVRCVMCMHVGVRVFVRF